MLRLVVTLFFLLVAFPLAIAPALAEESAAYRKALDDAQVSLGQGDAGAAIKHYRKAKQIAGGPTLETEIGLARAYQKNGAFKNGLECARNALELAEDPPSRLVAYDLLGAHLYQGGDAGPLELEQAADAFQRVLELSQGSANNARYSRGLILLKLERDEEGVALLEEYLANDPSGPAREHAESLVQNPRRARENLLPAFELVTLDGESLTPEMLEGKVVLLDFWGTWCAPCVAAIPHLRRLNKRSEKSPFVIVSVSTDSDEAKLRSFVDEKEMTWPQVWDPDHSIARNMFGVRGYPTYILVDHEGVVQFRDSGWSSRLEKKINTVVSLNIRKAKKAGE